ncbi:MAG: SDR family NAD(P)-dependent oxidoreductase [Myxococcota bacterium]
MQGNTRGSRKTAIVTGASSGIGEATARELARRGFDIALIARREDRLNLLAKDLEALGARAYPIAADLAEEDETERAAQEAIESLGRVDVLVNNAGYSPGAALEQVSRTALRHIFDVNVLSALHLAGAVAPLMREQGSGRIINVGSLAGAVPAPLAVPYSSTKAAIKMATESLRLELSQFGIRVTLIVPGFVDTAVFDNAREGSQHLRDDPTNPYQKLMFDLDDLAKKNLANPLQPETIAEVIAKAATEENPKARYYAPLSAMLQSFFLSLMPARWLDTILSRVYKLPPS